MKVIERQRMNRALARLLALQLVVLTVSAAAVSAQAPRPMTIVDLIDVPRLSDPLLSPDGGQILYSRSGADWQKNETVTHLWRVNVDGSGAVQLTNGTDGERSGVWSPDGSRIAFIAQRGDDSVSQVYLMHNEGGEGIRLTEHATSVGDLAWSPDGDWIYFTAEDDLTPEEKARKKIHDNVFKFDENRKDRHLWRVAVATGEEERLTEGDFHVAGYTLSRDGTLILHQRAPTPLIDDGEMGELWVMSAAGENARKLTDNPRREGSYELSPDNSTVMFVANSNQDFEYYYNDKIFTFPVSGGRAEVLLPEFPDEITSASWSADGGSIYFTANTGVRQDLFSVDVASRKVTQLTEGDHTLSSWSYAPKLDRHVFTISSPSNAGDIYTMAATAGAEPQKVTAVFDYLAEDFRLPKVEVVQWKGEDGVTVEGLLFYPLDYVEGQRYPLVVQTHGGPAASDKLTFFSAHDYIPVLASMGYVVLKPNYRGSTGYGDPFLRDMVGHYFHEAHKDVMAGVDYLIDRGIADGDHMAAMGWSGGGHMTDKLITYTDRFKAASSGAGAVDWLGMYAQSDTRVYRTPWFGASPWGKDAPIDKYIEASPIFDIWKVTTPTIVLVGEKDERVPPPQSIELYRALKSNGVPTHLYMAPDQPHGWQMLQQRLFKANVELDWFEKWVRDRKYAWEKSPVTPKAGAVSTEATSR